MKNITESLIECKKCKGNACSEISNGKLTVWTCFGCGFATNSSLTPSIIDQIEQTLPELYKDLRFIDDDGKYWYPLAVTMENKSMLFAEGKTIENWKWSAVKSKDGKTDMTTKKEFEQNDFLEALDYIQYFQQARSFL